MNKVLPYFLLASLLGSCKVKKESMIRNSDKLYGSYIKPIAEIKQEQFIIEGCRRRISGDYNAALVQFNEALKIDPENDVALYNIALTHFFNQEYNKALAYIKPLLKLNHTNKWYKLTAVDIYEITDHYAEAALIMEALAKEYPAELDYQFDYAYFLIKSNDYQKAISVYDQIEKYIGLNEEIANSRKQLWLKLNKPEKAVEELKALIKTDPREAKYYAMLADLYIALQANEQAYQTVQQLIEIDSTNSKAQSIMADYYLSVKNYQRAFSYLRNVFKSPDVDIDYKVKVLFSYLDLLQESNRKNEAIILGTLLTEAHPNEAKAYAIFGDILFNSYEDIEALNVYYKTLELDKSRFSVWQQVFLLQSRLGLKEDLLVYTTQALELFPYQPLVFYYNGLAWLDKKEYRKALIPLESMLQFEVEDVGLKSQVQATIGDCYDALDDFNMAERYYEDALSTDPDNTYALNNYAYHLAKRGVRLDKAEQMAAKLVLQVAPDNVTYIDTYAWVLFKQKKYQIALSWLGKAITPNTKQAEILEHYGDILFQTGKVDEAIIYWQRALQNGGDKQVLQKKINDRKTTD
ncbi:MAG: tetratricopeptide repeat protein [Bacteroidota bacterium]